MQPSPRWEPPPARMLRPRRRRCASRPRNVEGRVVASPGRCWDRHALFGGAGAPWIYPRSCAELVAADVRVAAGGHTTTVIGKSRTKTQKLLPTLGTERNDLLPNAMAITWKSPTLRNEVVDPPFFLAVSLIHGEMRRLRNFKRKLLARNVRTKRSRAVARALVWGESTFLKVEKFKIKHLTLNFDLVGRSPRPDSVALLSGRLRRPDYNPQSDPLSSTSLDFLLKTQAT